MRRQPVYYLACSAAAALALPGPAHSEGRRTELTCHAVTQCDGNGACSPANAEMTFLMQPLNVDGDGAGSFDISYDGGTYAMSASSALGPFVWSEGVDDTQLIMPTGADTIIWSSHNDNRAPASVVRFMECKGG